MDDPPGTNTINWVTEKEYMYKYIVYINTILNIFLIFLWILEGFGKKMVEYR